MNLKKGGSGSGAAGYIVEKGGIELEGKTSIAGCVFVRAFIAAPGVSQQKAPGQHQRSALRAPIKEAAEQHQRDRDRQVAFLERTITGTETASKIDHAPSAARCENIAFCLAVPAGMHDTMCGARIGQAQEPPPAP